MFIKKEHCDINIVCQIFFLITRIAFNANQSCVFNGLHLFNLFQILKLKINYHDFLSFIMFKNIFCSMYF